MKKSFLCLKDRFADRIWKDIVQIEVKLADYTNTPAAFAINWYHSLHPKLDLLARPDHAWIDGSGCDLRTRKLETGVTKLASTSGMRRR
ncbi:MAG: hypothetical protein WCC41_01680 [Rhodomicrobium sp.]